MKKLFLTLSLALCCVFAAQSQSTYKSAIGLRLGYPVSVSFKHFISEPGAIEVFAGFRGYTYYNWFNVGGLYEHHFAISEVTGLQWYVGGGASVFFWNFDRGFAYGDAGNTSFGVMAALGLDYKFENAPFELSVDWLPTVFLNGYGNTFGGGYGALAARYVLK